MYTLFYIRILYIEFYNLAVMLYGYSENTTSPFNFLYGTFLNAYRSFLSGSRYILFVYFNGFPPIIVLELKYCFVVEKGDSGISLNFSFILCKGAHFSLSRYLISFFIIPGLGGNIIVSPEDAGCWEMANFFSLFPRRAQVNSSSLCIWQCW